MATDRLINKDQGDQIITKLDAIKTAMQTQTDGIVSDAFNENASYYAGDYCIYNDTLYKFTSDHSGAWNLADVTATNVGDELASVKSALSTKMKGKYITDETANLVLNVPRGSMHQISVIAANANYCGMFLVWCAENSDNVGVSEINKGSSLTVTPSNDGKLTITPSTSATLTIIDLVGRGDAVTIYSD